MYEGKNINLNLKLRSKLKITKMCMVESVHEYFTRVSQFKEQLDAIGDSLNEDEVVMIGLNGITIPWDFFIHIIYEMKEILKFNILWEACVL